MFRVFTCLALASAILVVSGCGGTTSQKELMRKAIRRPSDDEPSDAPVKKTSRKKKDDDAATKTAASERNPTESTEVKSATNNNRSATESDSGTENQVAHTSADLEIPSPGSVEENEQAYLDRLERLGQGLAKYFAEKSAFPEPAIMANRDTPLLSWRVQLLPYLGYERLYSRFRLDEPWDSPHNAKLLEMMPEEFYTGAQDSGHTCVQVPVASYSAYNGRRVTYLRNVEAGVGNVVAMVVVDPSKAVPWTKPEEYSPPARNPAEGLAEFNGDHYLVLWASGSATPIINTASPSQYQSMFKILESARFKAADLLYSGAVAGTDTPGSSPEVAVSTSSGTLNADQPGMAERDAIRNEAAGLSQELMAIVQRRFDAGELDHTLDLLDLSLLVNPGDQLVTDMKWLPAVSRPVVIPRVGIGVECPLNNRVSDPSPIRMERSSADRNRTAAMSRAVDGFLGDFGGEILGSLNSRIEAGDWGHWAQVEPTSKRSRTGQSIPLGQPHTLRPGIDFLGNNTRRNLMQLAQHKGLDVLLFFEVKLSRTRQNVVHNTTKLTVFDVAKAEPIYEADEMNNIQVYVARQNPLESDPLVAVLNDFDKWARANLTLQDIPQLSPEEVRTRMEQTAADTEGYSWDAALEARLYYKLGLISRVEYEQWVEKFTGVPAQQLLNQPGEEILATLLETRSPEFAKLTREALEAPPEDPNPRSDDDD